MTFQELMGAFYINDSLCNDVIYRELLEQMRTGYIIPVIGAGLSKWAGYPLWRDLLSDKAEKTRVEKKINELLNEEKYEAAASRLESFYGHNTFLEAVGRSYDPEKICEENRPHYQRLFGRLFPGSIVTTNFDVCLERLFGGKFVVAAEDQYTEDQMRKRLQQNQPLLIKLHGTVEAPEQLILTEASYNRAYGNDPENPDTSRPLPAALTAIFQAAPPLFLGCSLGEDRTCKVLRACTGNIGYALMELPKETDNPDNPCEPHLYDEDDDENDWIPAFESRRNWLETMGVRVIWYPHGMYEAVGVLIEQLANDLGISGDPAPPSREALEASNYRLSGHFIGRDALVQETVDCLKDPSVPLIVVHGAAGIGKTEICKAAYNDMKRADPTFSMPMVDLIATASLEDFLCRIAEGLGFSIRDYASEKLLPVLRSRICSLRKAGIPLVYLDNFEDAWPDTAPAQNDMLSALKALMSDGLRLLVASQADIPGARTVQVVPLDGGVDVSALSWEEFSALNRVRLFIDTLGREVRPDEHEALIRLTNEMEGHPLSIVLTASYGRDCGSLNDLLTIWHAVDIPILDNYGGRHNSLYRAFAVAWSKVRGNPAASLRWAIHALSVFPLDGQTLQELRDAADAAKAKFTDREWLDGQALLHRLGLVEFGEYGRERMLLAVKKTFFQFEDAASFVKAAFAIWTLWTNQLLETGMDRKHPDYYACHNRALAWLPQCWELAERCLEARDFDALAILLCNAGNYYQFNIAASLPLLHRMLRETPEKFVLRSQIIYLSGDLLGRIGKLDDALKAYDEAEKLYIDERVNLGRANVLQSRGDLLQDQEDWAEASACYEKAIELYREEQDSMGLCYALSELFFCKMRLGDLAAAAQYRNEIETLLPGQPDDVKNYVIKKLKGAR